MPTNIDIYKTVAAAMNHSAMVVRIPEDDYDGFKNTVQGMTAEQLSANGLINDFISTMINTVGMYYIMETGIRSRFGRFMRDTMEFGRFIQIAGVNPAVGMDYHSEMDAEDFNQINPFLGQKPSVVNYFYQLNEKRRYAVFLNYMDFKQAFNNATFGFETFIMQFIESTSAARSIDIDNFFKETFNDVINATGSGNIKLAMKASQKVEVDGFDTAANAASSLVAIQKVVSDMIIRPSADYNEASFMCMQRPDNLILFVRPDVINALNTQVQAFAYNADKLTFTPPGLDASIELMVVPDFGGTYPADSSNNRIYPKYNELGQWDGTYVTTDGGSTTATFAKMVDPNANVMCVLCDKERPMIVNNKLFSRQTQNDATGNGVYHLHDWNMFVQNQFRNCAVFTTA